MKIEAILKKILEGGTITAEEKDILVEMDWIKWWKKDASGHIDVIYGQYLGPRNDIDLLKQAFDSLTYECDKTIDLMKQGKKEEVLIRVKTMGIVSSKVDVLLKKAEVIYDFSIKKGDELYDHSVKLKELLEKQLFLLMAIVASLRAFIHFHMAVFAVFMKGLHSVCSLVAF